MLALIVAGEAVFSLPFHVARFFRPTVLQVFDLSNTELGAAQAVYGVVAMLAYFPGGPLADRFPARRLLTVSLLATSLGGLYFVTFPPIRGLSLLFGFWGLTTILLFWAALIRATREWGGESKQGRAFGILDGGRGLLAAVMAAVAVAVFEQLMPGDPTDAIRARALRGIIYMYTGVTAGAGILCWVFVPESKSTLPPGRKLRTHIGGVVRMRRVWLQALIVVCAYIGYKGVDGSRMLLSEWVTTWARTAAWTAGGMRPSSIAFIKAKALCVDASSSVTTDIPSSPAVINSSTSNSSSWGCSTNNARQHIAITNTKPASITVTRWLRSRLPEIISHNSMPRHIAIATFKTVVTSRVTKPCVVAPMIFVPIGITQPA